MDDIATLPTSDRRKYAVKHININDIIKYRERGLSTREIGKILGCSHQAVLYQLKTHGVDLDEYLHFKANPDTHIELLQYRILKSLTDEDLLKINAYQRVIAFAALDDKKRLHRGQSTANVAIDYRQSIAEIDAELQRLTSIPHDLPSSNEDDNDIGEPIPL